MAKRPSKTADLPFEGRSGLLFATNRANVLPILSSGLIRPRAGYEKYYDDLLALCPGYIPLWSQGFPKSFVSLLTAGEPGMFPVLVELDSKQVSAKLRTRFAPELTVIGGDQPTAANSVLCELVGSPIPIGAVKALHFATQDDLEDFRAREFGNVLALPPLSVTPAAFSSDGPDPSLFAEAIRGVPQAPGTAADFRRLDSAMGAIAMLSLLLPTSKAWIDSLATAIASPAPAGPAPSGALGWMASLASVVLSPDDCSDSRQGVDLRLVYAAIDLLRSSSPRDGWVEAKVVTELASRASDGASVAELQAIESWRDVVISIARADKQVGSLDDSGSLIRRALMLLVLRCQPERIMGARETSLQPGPQVTAIAGMFSGLFQGYSRLSREIKEKACPQDLLSRLALGWWSAIDDQPRKILVGSSAKRVDPTTSRIAVTVDRGVFVERECRPSDAMMRLFYHAKGVGYAFEYDPALEAFVHEAATERETKRRIIIESGRPTPRGQPTIRVRAVCIASEGKPVRLSKREDAIALLERNHDPATQCRFAVEPVTGSVEVLVHQLLETMDSPELQAHIEAVLSSASDFEEFWAARASSQSQRPDPPAPRSDPPGRVPQ